jgi:hypothetical protein
VLVLHQHILRFSLCFSNTIRDECDLNQRALYCVSATSTVDLGFPDACRDTSKPIQRFFGTHKDSISSSCWRHKRKLVHHAPSNQLQRRRCCLRLFLLISGGRTVLSDHVDSNVSRPSTHSRCRIDILLQSTLVVRQSGRPPASGCRGAANTDLRRCRSS